MLLIIIVNHYLSIVDLNFIGIGIVQDRDLVDINRDLEVRVDARRNPGVQTESVLRKKVNKGRYNLYM